MKTANHGGECCGLDHVWDFENCSKEAIKQLERAIREIINDVDGDCDGVHDGTRAVEVVLTDRQLSRNDSAWAKCLKDFGFKLTARWQNPNSGNYCNQFMLFEDDGTQPPYEW